MTRENITTAKLDDDAMWRAIETRDRRFDERFCFGVRSTGIYCRPSCPARRPHRANVTFYASPDAAERAGFRACLRCRPRDVSSGDVIAQRMIAACRALDQQSEGTTIDDLAAAAGMSRFHFQRSFKSVVGVTPKAYAQAVRRCRVRRHLEASRSVTDAIHDAGYGASSRFYAEAVGVLGMTAKAFRSGGEAIEIRYGFARSSLGEVLVAATDAGVCAILIGDDRDALRADLSRRFPKARSSETGHGMTALVAAVVTSVDQPGRAHDLPLDIKGTAFQHRVWQALRSIPPGETTTYAAIAERIGAKGASRAVAGACAANPLAVVVPCHRVVRSDGDVSGYRWGVERKRELLAREAAAKARPAGPDRESQTTQPPGKRRRKRGQPNETA